MQAPSDRNTTVEISSHGFRDEVMTAARPVVFLVNDDAGVMDTLKRLVPSLGYDLEMYSDGPVFLDGLSIDTGGCVLLDVRMAVPSGGNLLVELTKRKYPLPVVVMAGYGDLQTAVQAMKDGAYDFLQKPFDEPVLVKTIKTAVARGQKAFEEAYSESELQQRFDRLTLREAEVLDLIVSGESNNKIAVKLDVSKKTIENHRFKIMDKIKANSLASLIKLSMKACRN